MSPTCWRDRMTGATYHMNIAEQALQQLLLGPAVRQNHALEHATIVTLGKEFPGARMSGISFARGFFVFGDLPTSAIRPAAQRALEILRNEDPGLAIHERCGTNLAVAGILTGASAMAVAKLRKPYSTFSNVILASTAALVIARPLGLLVQRYVTTRTPGRSMRVGAIRAVNFPGPGHFVETENKGATLFRRGGGREPAPSLRVV